MEHTQMSKLQSAPQETSETALRRNRLGVLGIVFFVVAAAAPLVGMTGAVPVAIVLGDGAGTPGAYLAVGLTLLVFSVGYAAMSQHVVNAGAFFAYVGRGLGVAWGVGSSFVSLLAYVAIQLAIYGFFGVVAAGQMSAKFNINEQWYVWALIAWALVLLLSYFTVDVGAKVLGVMMILEIISLSITAIAVIAKGGGPEGLHFGASFSPSAIAAGTPGIAFAFAFASFIGFEATAIYGEEAKDPKRAVPKATYLAIGLITILFAATSFAIVSGLGATHIVETVTKITSVGGTPLADPSQALFNVATTFVGSWLATVMGWLVLSSLFAGLLAFQNSAARYFFAMGRAGVLPKKLDHVNKKGAPWNASLLTGFIALVVIVFFAVRKMDPFTELFSWFSALAVVAIVLVEMLVCLAVIRYFRISRTDTRLWHTMIAPLLAFIGLGGGEYLLMSRFGLLAGTAPKGVDPTVTSWALNPTGWVLVLSSFVIFIAGAIIGKARQKSENQDLVKDLVN
jgi:amino acid transporter